MDYSSDSQGKLQTGFEPIYSESDVSVLLLKSSPEHLSHFLPQKVKVELQDFFCETKNICNLQKARNYALGRWVGFELLERICGSDFIENCKIKNSSDEICFGKPSIYQNNMELHYCISLSHSDYYALSGFSRVKEIGVDLEHIRPRSDSFNDLVLTAKEKLNLRSNDARRDELVSAMWAGKEAVSKVLGRGLRTPLKNFEIELNLEGLYRSRMKCRVSDPGIGIRQFWIRMFQKNLSGGRYIICVAGSLNQYDHLGE